ncbi:LysR family transcriptional regulator [Marinobacterium mangrovicola]|uniref:LysR family transcriptional regulator n=1 Tax=Marinobacterium mangrovicola TaxID=1476959 RepID=A0A4R1GPF6_9GAMM|nr:LysR family transcriptional regulator [Marinobacterium mangrovicola]TCK09190.1 LysR family transcriptional regulator [Marinobacterium mangrovicola]
MLNPQWLASFAVLAEVGNFTRTAERLDMTQAAVSQHIRRLELELGQLVIRHPRQIELTPAGLALLEYINEIAQADKRLQHRLNGENNRTGEVSLISPGSVGLTLYPILLDLQQNNHGLTIRHRFAPDSEVLEAVKQNHYELGIVTLKPDDSRLTASRFSEEPLELIVPANYSVSGWEELEQLGFIDHPDGLVMADRMLSRRYPGKPGIHSIPRKGFINQISLILEPVARGLGFTVLPRYARQAFSRQSDITVIEGTPEIKETLWLIHRAEWPLSAHAAWVAEQLREAVAALEQL